MTERGYPTLNLSAIIQPPKAGFWGTDERTAGTRTAVRIVRNGDVAKDGYIPRSSLPVRWVNDRERDAAITRDSDCILVSSGAYTGVTGKILDDTADDLPVIVSNFVRRVRPLEGVDPTWLFHSLRSAGVQAQVWPHTGGSAMPNLNRSFFERCVLPVPGFAVQGRIAEILDTVDNAIRLTEGLIAKLEKTRRGLLHDLLTRGIDEDGALRDPDRHPEQFEAGPTGRTPRDWSVRRLGECADTFAGGTPSRAVSGLYGGSIPWVKSGELNQAVVAQTEESITQRALAISAVRMVPAGVPIVAMYGATAGVVSWLAIAATTNQAVLAIVPMNDAVRPRWLYWELSLATERLLRSIQGSGQPNLSKRTIDDTVIAVPSPDEQERITQVADGFAQRLADERKALAKLVELKRGLADDLLTGRVRVNRGCEGAT